VGDDLAVTFRRDPVLPEQESFQFLIIVDFAVVDQGKTLIAGEEGLAGLIPADDAEPGMAQGDFTVNQLIDEIVELLSPDNFSVQIDPMGIGAAMSHFNQHVEYIMGLDLAFQDKVSAYGAHRNILSLKFLIAMMDFNEPEG
jgi:hypothetical protein